MCPIIVLPDGTALKSPAALTAAGLEMPDRAPWGKLWDACLCSLDWEMVLLSNDLSFIADEEQGVVFVLPPFEVPSQRERLKRRIAERRLVFQAAGFPF